MVSELSDKAGATRDTLQKLVAKKRGKYPAAAAEVITGDKWHDGSEIRRTVYSGITGPNATTVTQAHGLTTPTLAGRGIYGSGDNATDQLAAPNQASGEDVGLKIDDTNISITSASDLSGYTFYVVLEYVL